MSSGGTDWEYGGDPTARPFGARSEETRPFGARPFGARPFGARPFGARADTDDKPFGARPFGARDDDDRPFGARPFGARPFGARPFGARPFGARPFGARLFDGDEAGALLRRDWSAVLAELVCERSTVIRMGATLSTGFELRVPAFNPVAGVRAPGGPGPVPIPYPAAGEPALRPGDRALEAAVEIPNRLADAIAEHEEVAWSLLIDLAEALALQLDGACLGTPPWPPVVTTPAAQMFRRLRNLVQSLRGAYPVRTPGWILHPNALDTIARFLTRNGETSGTTATGRTIDSFQWLVTPDGVDGGTLLGFPFLISAAAGTPTRPLAFLSVDWQEAWLGVEPYLAWLDVTGEPAPSPDSTVLRASLPVDFVLRRPTAFAVAVV